MTSLNIIYRGKLLDSKEVYQGNPSGFRSTRKQYCQFDGTVFKVPNGHLGWYPKILFRFYKQLNVLFNETNCVMVVRFDLHVGGNSDNNKVMTTFWRRLSKRLSRKYTAIRLGNLWVREQGESNSPHYHVVVMVDKNTIYYSRTITDAIIETWQGITGLQAHIPENCYYTVKKGVWGTFEQVLWRVSYLAKTRSKGKRPSQTKDFGSSRLKTNS